MVRKNQRYQTLKQNKWKTLRSELTWQTIKQNTFKTVHKAPA